MKTNLIISFFMSALIITSQIKCNDLLEDQEDELINFSELSGLSDEDFYKKSYRPGRAGACRL